MRSDCPAHTLTIAAADSQEEEEADRRHRKVLHPADLHIEAWGPTREECIDEVIYWLDAYGEIPLSVVVRPAPDGGVVLFLVLARAADAEIFGAVQKAASPHHLRCAPDPAGRWSCAITVDV